MQNYWLLIEMDRLKLYDQFSFWCPSVTAPWITPDGVLLNYSKHLLGKYVNYLLSPGICIILLNS